MFASLCLFIYSPLKVLLSVVFIFFSVRNGKGRALHIPQESIVNIANDQNPLSVAKAEKIVLRKMSSAARNIIQTALKMITTKVVEGEKNGRAK